MRQACCRPFPFSTCRRLTTERPAKVTGAADGDGALWVFGYGSLMWQPGFDHAERRRATLAGYHRALCGRTVHHRGTTERPGLVMGLAPGDACVGVAFRVAPGSEMAVRAYLHECELRYQLIDAPTVPQWSESAGTHQAE